MPDATSVSRAQDRRWLILGVIGLAQLMVVLDLTVMNIALPTAQRALHFQDIAGLRPGLRVIEPEVALLAEADLVADALVIAD